jgi:predicted enzyme related to lactoylglutathione lyase
MQYNAVFVAIATVNLANLVNFYHLLLELEPEKLIPDIYAEFHLVNFQLSIFQPKATHKAEFATVSKSPLSLCLAVNNLETAMTQLTNLGHLPDVEIFSTDYGREIYAYDPDGNRLILYQQHSPLNQCQSIKTIN